MYVAKLYQMFNDVGSVCNVKCQRQRNVINDAVKVAVMADLALNLRFLPLVHHKDYESTCISSVQNYITNGI